VTDPPDARWRVAPVAASFGPPGDAPGRGVSGLTAISAATAVGEPFREPASLDAVSPRGGAGVDLAGSGSLASADMRSGEVDEVIGAGP